MNNPATPLPIRKALLQEAMERASRDKRKLKLPIRVFPWRRLVILSLAGIVIGNSLVTLFLYVMGHAEYTAWTGTVPQSTPSAINDLLLGCVNLMLALYLLRKCV